MANIDPYQNILNEINNIKSVKLVDFCKINKNLTNFKRFSISSRLNIDMVGSLKSYNIDPEKHAMSLLMEEMTQTIVKEIYKNLFNTINFDYLDVRGVSMGIDDPKKSKELIDLILQDCTKYKNISSCTKLGVILQDYSNFSVKPFDSTSRLGALTYKIGKIYEMEVWIDPYMRWNDTKLCLFNDVEVNVENFNSKIVPNPFSTHLSVDFDLAINVGDSKIIFVIEDGSSINILNEYKSLRTSVERDIKIDSVLDDKKNDEIKPQDIDEKQFYINLGIKK